MQYNTEILVACTELIKVNKKLSCELLFVWWFCLFLNGDGRKTLVFISLFPCFFALKQGQKEEHKVCIEIWVLGPVSTPITDRFRLSQQIFFQTVLGDHWSRSHNFLALIIFEAEESLFIPFLSNLSILCHIKLSQFSQAQKTTNQ